MLRNWVTQFGFDAGMRAGDERISPADRGKFISQIGAYLGWNPPPNVNWVVEVAKDEQDQYVLAFFRYATPDEADKLLGTDYQSKPHTCTCRCHRVRVPDCDCSCHKPWIPTTNTTQS